MWRSHFQVFIFRITSTAGDGWSMLIDLDRNALHSTLCWILNPSTPSQLTIPTWWILAPLNPISTPSQPHLNLQSPHGGYSLLSTPSRPHLNLQSPHGGYSLLSTPSQPHLNPISTYNPHMVDTHSSQPHLNPISTYNPHMVDTHSSQPHLNPISTPSQLTIPTWWILLSTPSQPHLNPISTVSFLILNRPLLWKITPCLLPFCDK